MNIIELAISAQLIDHRDTEESLPADFVASLKEFAQLVRAAAIEECAELMDGYDYRRLSAEIRALKERK